MARIVFENVGKTYTAPGEPLVEAVRNLNLTIEDGELLVLVGPSGSGKTTILRLLAGLETVTTGTIRMNGQVLNSVPPGERDLAMVFQNHALFPHLTVFANLALGLRLRKMARGQIEQRVREVAERLELTPLLESGPANLSGGQRQRVALARALVRRPKGFLLDEPLASLDAPMRQQLRTEIARLHAHSETTMLYVTHDQTEALALGRRIAVMRAGEIQQIAEPELLYRAPANLFVARFIGSPPINVIEGTVVSREGSLFFRAKFLGGEAAGREDPGGWRVADEFTDALLRHLGEPVVLGIRPEALVVQVEPAAAASTIGAVIEFIERTGWAVDLHLRCEEQKLTARVPPGEQWALGQRVHLVPDLGRVRYFANDTGQAIA